MKHWKIIIFVFLLNVNNAISTLQLTDKIIAIVNNDIILESDIKKDIRITTSNNILDKNKTLLSPINNYLLHRQILKQLITDTLILQIAKTYDINLNINNNQIHEIIKKLANQNQMTTDQFSNYLYKSNINFKNFLEKVHIETIKKYICTNIASAQINISQNEIYENMNTWSSIDFTKKFKLIHILISTPIQPTQYQKNNTNLLIQSLIKTLEHTNDIQYAKNLIAKFSSQNKLQLITIKENHWTDIKNIPPLFDKYLPIIRKNSIIGPINSFEGIHLIKVCDICQKETQDLEVKVHIKQIVLKNLNSKKNSITEKEKLLKIKNQIENNEGTFSIFAQKESEDLESAYQGGDLGWKNLKNFEKQIQNVILSLRKNEISIPIYSNSKWYLIKLIDIYSLNYNDTIQERIYLYLFNKKLNEEINNLIQKLHCLSYIKIIDEKYQ